MSDMFHLLPDVITKDFLRKLIALFFALLVWISVKNTIGVEQILPGQIPVTFSLPSDFVMTNKTQQKVTIKVRASERLLNRLRPEQFTINLPIKASQYKQNEPVSIIVKPTDVTTPLGVTVVGVEMGRVMAYLDRIISKKVTVIHQFEGSQEGYTTGKVTLTPSEVTITGPSNMLETRESINTQPIPLAQMTDSFEFEPKLALNDSILTISKSSVLAKVEILKSYDAVTFNSIPIRVLNSTENAERFDIQLDKDAANILISGTKSVIELVKSDQIKAFLDISNLKEPGSYNVNLDCSISGSAASIKHVTPPSVKVTLTEKR